MQVLEYAKGLVSAALFMVILYGGFWVKRIFDQKRKNTVDEIDLSFKKIDLDTHSQPIDDLVADSNKSHGVVKGPRDGS